MAVTGVILPVPPAGYLTTLRTADRKDSGVNGFLKKTIAPMSNPRLMASRSPLPVTKTTGASRFLSSCLIRRTSSKPSIPGIMMSNTTASYSVVLSFSSASDPRVATSTAYPAPVRIPLSSSTTQPCSASDRP